MKFLLDMGISLKTAAFLRNLGYDAIHLYEQGLERLEDSAIFAKAEEEKRVILTYDLDFSEIVANSKAKLPSVVIFRLRNMHPNLVNRYLQTILSQHQKILEEGVIISVREGQIRIRYLPLTSINI